MEVGQFNQHLSISLLSYDTRAFKGYEVPLRRTEEVSLTSQTDAIK